MRINRERDREKKDLVMVGIEEEREVDRDMTDRVIYHTQELSTSV